MNQLDGKQIRNDSLSLSKLTDGVKFFTNGTMSFGSEFNLEVNFDSINNENSVVNKEYVDSIAKGLDIKKSVVIRIVDEDINLSGIQTIQSVTLEENDRVLINSYTESNPLSTFNNIYIVKANTWEVAQDAIPGDTLTNGSFTFIENGDYQNTGYVLTTKNDDLLQPSPSLNWVLFSNSDLPNTGVIPNIYGNEDNKEIPIFEVDSKGRILNASTYNLNLSIGNSEDGTYADGLFNNFDKNTPIGTAIDKFNETLLLLAPPRPKKWNNSLSELSFEETSKNARKIITGENINNLYINNEPSLKYTINNEVNIEEKSREAFGVFQLIDNGSNTLEYVQLNGDNTLEKTTGYLRHSSAIDPYEDSSSKKGFWKGIVYFEYANESLPTIQASNNERVLSLTHPGVDSPINFNYYIDNPLDTSISNINATFFSNNFISGLPCLINGDSITNISFDINNVSSFFYSNDYVWEIQEGLINYLSGDPDNIPTSNGETGFVSNKTSTIRNNQFSDSNINFSIRAKNSIGEFSNYSTFTNNNYRVDSISNEDNRLTSGNGNYPSGGYGNIYDSTQSLLVGDYTNELLLKNGKYQYPNGDYTLFGVGNYDNATGMRFATFNIGEFNENNGFTLNILEATNINSIINTNDFFIEIRIGTSSFWVNANSAYEGVGSPGSNIDGEGCVVVSNSTPTERRITFGSNVHSGDIIVRIGINENSLITFNNVTATNII